jgi:hypothetical protein
VSDSAPSDRFEGDVFLQPRGEPGEVVSVRIDSGGVSVGGAMLVLRENLWAGGFEELQEGGRCRVLIVAAREAGKSYRSWSLSVDDLPTAHALLHAAGLSTHERALHVKLERQFQAQERTAIALAIAACVVFGVLHIPGTKALISVAIGFAIWIAANVVTTPIGHVDLLIGTDGVLRKRAGKSRFIPFFRAKSVSRRDARVVLRLVDGEETTLSVDVPPSANPTDRANATVLADLLHLRVREGIEAAVKATKLLRQDFSVGRGTSEIQNWLAELRHAHRSGGATYRTAPPPDVDLDSLFANGLLDAQTRAGAAIALRAREGEDAAGRFRKAAAATASPTFRVALEKIAEGATDEEIARSIEKLR